MRCARVSFYLRVSTGSPGGEQCRAAFNERHPHLGSPRRWRRLPMPRPRNAASSNSVRARPRAAATAAARSERSWPCSSKARASPDRGARWSRCGRFNAARDDAQSCLCRMRRTSMAMIMQTAPAAPSRPESWKARRDHARIVDRYWPTRSEAEAKKAHRNAMVQMRLTSPPPRLSPRPSTIRSSPMI